MEEERGRKLKHMGTEMDMEEVGKTMKTGLIGLSKTAASERTKWYSGAPSREKGTREI